MTSKFCEECATRLLCSRHDKTTAERTYDNRPWIDVTTEDLRATVWNHPDSLSAKYATEELCRRTGSMR